MNLKQKTIRGLFWAGGAQGGKQFSQFIITAVLANLLDPADFGLLGMATFFTGLILVLNEMGLSHALIQKKGIRPDHYFSAFWLSLVVGIIFFLLMIPLSILIALFYETPSLRSVLLLLSTTFFLASFSRVHKTMLSRNMEFKKIAIIDSSAVLIGGIAGIISALNGFGVYSLIFQQLFLSITDVVLSWLFCGWRPRFRFSLPSLKEIWGFSFNLTAFNIVNYFARNLDYLLIGKFMGAQALGYYTMAYRLMTYPLQNISWTIMRVMFPAFSKIQEDLERVRFGYKKMIKAISLITFPMMMGFFIIAPKFIILVFGPQWKPAIPLVQIFCICGMIQSIGTTAGTLILSQGKAKLNFVLGTLFTITITFVILIGMNWGFIGVAIAYSIYSIVWIHGVNFLVTTNLIKLKYSDFYRQLLNSYFIAALMAIFFFLAKMIIPISQAAGIAALIGIGGVLYLGLLFLTKELFIRDRKIVIKVLE
ncbi:MOP flippase family protein [Acidobacteriota bacterium]